VWDAPVFTERPNVGLDAGSGSSSLADSLLVRGQEQTLLDMRGHDRTVASLSSSSMAVTVLGDGVMDRLTGRVSMAGETVDVLTADEAAAYLRVSLKTLYRLVSAGKVPGQKVGRSWRFRHADLVAFLQAR